MHTAQEQTASAATSAIGRLEPPMEFKPIAASRAMRLLESTGSTRTLFVSTFILLISLLGVATLQFGIPIGLVFVVAGLVLAVWMCVFVGGRREITADKVAEEIYKNSANKTQHLPDHMRGVFWMADNPGNELLMTMDGSDFDLESRTLKVTLAGPFKWSYSADSLGFLSWLVMAFAGSFCCGKGVFEFDENFKVGRISIHICGINIYALACADLLMTDVTPAGMEPGSKWLRRTTMCGVNFDMGNYTLHKVIGRDGQRIQPNFDALIESLYSADNNGVLVKGMMPKPLRQIMSGVYWPFVKSEVSEAPAQAVMNDSAPLLQP